MGCCGMTARAYCVARYACQLCQDLQSAANMPSQHCPVDNKRANKVAIYTRTSSKKSEVCLSTSKNRQVQSCLRALNLIKLRGPGTKTVLKVSEVKSGRLPLSKRPAFEELVSGQTGKLKVFVESARAVARDVCLFAAVWPNSNKPDLKTHCLAASIIASIKQT